MRSSKGKAGDILVCNRSYEYLLALASGIPIISADWLVDCRGAKIWVDIEPYKVWGDTRTYSLADDSAEETPEWLRNTHKLGGICRLAFRMQDMIREGRRSVTPLLDSFATVVLSGSATDERRDEFSAHQICDLIRAHGGTLIKKSTEDRWIRPSSSTRRIVIVPDSFAGTDIDGADFIRLLIPELVKASIFPEDARLSANRNDPTVGHKPLSDDEHNIVHVVRMTWLLDTIAAYSKAPMEKYRLGWIQGMLIAFIRNP